MNKIKFFLTILLIISIKKVQAQPDTILNKQEKGFFNLIEGGYLYGLNERTIRLTPNSISSITDVVNVVSLRNISGFFLTNHLSFGIGVGADGYQVKDGGFYNTFQIFGDVRYYFKNQESTWYLFGNLGRAIAIDDGFEEGLSGGGGIGKKIMISYKTGLTASFGYNEQEIKTVPQVKQRIPTFAFRVGLLF